MLEEIIALFFSLFSSVTMDAPRISVEMNADEGSEPSTLDTWQNKIHTEYASHEQENCASRVEYVQVGYELRMKPSYSQSLLRSVKVTFSMMIGLPLLVIIGIAFIYFNVRISNLCFVWKAQNYKLSFDVMKIRLIGEGIAILILNLWYSMTLIVLFGWREFKNHFPLTILYGLLAALIYILYLTFLLLYGVYDTNHCYRIPGYVLYACGILFQSVIAIRKIRQNHPTTSYSNRHIFTVVSVPILCGFAISLVYKYVIVMVFISLDNVLYRFIMAILTPAIAMILTPICRHIAVWRTSEIIQPERSFGLVYFLHSAAIILYRIMQTGFKSIWLFVGLSMLAGVCSVLKIATFGIRGRVWGKVIMFLNKTCCSRLRHLPEDTPHHRRLKADIQIQNILVENNSLILTLAYLVLYYVTSFELSDWSIVKETLVRIAIGLVTEFVFNILSTFIRIHWYDIPLRQVWSKYWKQHLFANGIIFVIVICNFTKPLLEIYHDRHANSGTADNILRNCTLPYQNWR